MTSASWYNAVRETITSNIFAKNVWPESNHEDIIKSRTGTFYEATGEEGAFLEYMRPKIYTNQMQWTYHPYLDLES